MNQNQLHKAGNMFGLILISLILVISFLDQLSRHDLPCPLCLLQRIGFVAVGLCMCMNLKMGIKPSHYGLMILSALFGLAVALRQNFLHLTPNDPGYGHLIFGLYAYVWSAIIFTLMLIAIGGALIFERGFGENQLKINRFSVVLILVFLSLILLNGVSTLIECGTLTCKDNPVRYELLKDLSLNSLQQYEIVEVKERTCVI